MNIVAEESDYQHGHVEGHKTFGFGYGNLSVIRQYFNVKERHFTKLEENEYIQ